MANNGNLDGHTLPQVHTPNRTLDRVNAGITPRLMVEVSRHNGICVASNVPDFYDRSGLLNIQDLRAHVKARQISKQFCGYAFASILDSEDQVEHLNIFPHIFFERMVLYKPDNLNLLEMCALISIVENLRQPCVELCMSIRARLATLHAKTLNKDSLFLYIGGKTLLSTIVHYYELAHKDDPTWDQGLTMFRLHKELAKAPCEARDLLQSVYLTSTKMGRHTTSAKEYCSNMNKEDTESECTFNLFHQDSILTKHFQCQEVLKTLRSKCLYSKPVFTIIN
ncbi:ORF33 [callitrichine gammaherpesvirus 3]|uniref:ORF33 n=1 Tax=callitrichine gammaherpesvirus 3 TaxID=106331 RepID=Q993H7_9GAMA|nr:ORF33 [callitrichine gammaherpesvirus 3]AAK38241.1 ORF33 [callitrichine gammaherpesvirus 3]